MTRKITLSLLLTGAVSFYFQSNLLIAQERNPSEQTSNNSLPSFKTNPSTGSFQYDMDGKNVTSKQLINRLNEWMNANSDHTFKIINEESDDLGFKHTTLQHYYKNVKVADEIVSLHEKNGFLTYVNGEVTSKIDLSTGNSLFQSETETIVKADLKKNIELSFSNFEQAIATIDTGRGIQSFYVSKIDVFAASPLQSFTYYIDNSSRKIINKLSKIRHTDTPSTSATLNKGNQQITVDSYNGSYRLKDNARKIYTYNGTNTTINPVTGTLQGITNAEYTSNTPNFTSDATKAAVEVHWGMEKTYDYYLTRHSRNSYDGLGSVIKNYYNFSDSGDGTNAAAVDNNGQVFMIFGSGKYLNAQVFNPLVNLDVTGHEYTHLINGRNGHGGLNYQKESGALDESIADMMGTAIEFYSGITPNWTIGEGIPIPVSAYPGTYFRNMANPNVAQSIAGSAQPDTYLGTYWQNTNVTPSESNDQGGVHTNSGVGNYWFYLLSVGGSGTNDIGNTFAVSGITIQKAEKIVFRALMNYLTPNSGYMDFYNATKKAAIDLYGITSNEGLQVAKAWYAVGIGNGVLATTEVKPLENNIKIYPNPVTQGSFTIETKENRDTKYELYDLSGKLLIPSQKLNSGINKVSVAGIQSGVYLLKLISEGNTVSKKIIIK